MNIFLSAITTAESRLIYINHRDGSPRLGSGKTFADFKLPQYPSSPQQMSDHLKRRCEDNEGNANRRETELGNAVLDYLAAGGSKARLTEIVDSVPPDEHLPAFLEDNDGTRNRLTELLQKIPVVELP